MAGHDAPPDGPSRGRSDGRRRRGSALYIELRATGRRAAVFWGTLPVVRAGDPVPLFELWVDRRERGHRTGRGRTFLHVHAEAGLRASRNERHPARLRGGNSPRAGDAVLPEVWR